MGSHEKGPSWCSCLDETSASQKPALVFDGVEVISDTVSYRTKRFLHPMDLPRLPSLSSVTLDIFLEFELWGASEISLEELLV